MKCMCIKQVNKLLLFSIFFSACHAGGYSVKPVNSKSYALQAIQEVTVGSPMISTDEQTVKRGRWIGVLYSPSGYEETVSTFKRELIYGGKTGTTVNIFYREYGDNFARPAFAQELKYYLKDSKDISFQNFQIHVLSANNSKVKFKVTAD